ncbi:MAG: acyl-CoA dehydrogenase, partial [Actinomycetota bacterium]
MNPVYERTAEEYREKVQAFLAEKLPSNWKGIGSMEGKEAEDFVAQWREILAGSPYLAPGWP